MKKNLLFICALLVATITFAQQRMMLMPEQAHLLSKNVQCMNPLSPPSPSSIAPPFFTDDFSNSNYWTMTDLTNGGAQNWVIGTNGPTGTFSAAMNAIASTSGGNFALFDSDALSISYTNTQDAILAFNNSIDCSLYQYVNINFESNYRKYADSIFVEVSNDNVNWDRYEVHSDLSSNDGTSNPENVSVNITSTAGNQAAVWFRFRFEGVWDYAWMIDDVSFSETPNNEIIFSDETFGGWWLGYQLTGDIGADYTFYPMDQALAQPYRCEGVISNTGVMTQNNVMLNVNILDDIGTMLGSYQSSPSILNMGENDTVATMNTFTPTNYGYHQMNFWATSDSFPTTDTVGRGTIVTDTVYGVDFDWQTDGANAGSGYYLGRYCGGQVLGNAFDIYSTTNATSVSFHVNDQSISGAQLKVEIYELDPAASVQTSPPIWLGESDNYQLQTSDIDSWVTLTLTSPVSLFSGFRYLAAVHGYAHPTDTSLISSSSNPNASTYLQDNCPGGTNPAGTWYTISNPVLIRMNVNSIISNIDDNINEGKLYIYPNPTYGNITIDLRNTTTDNYVITVSNILGEEVYSYQAFVNGAFKKNVDLSSFAKGVYLLNISNSSSSVTERIVVE
jgi:hypothetical protein